MNIPLTHRMRRIWTAAGVVPAAPLSGGQPWRFSGHALRGLEQKGRVSLGKGRKPRRDLPRYVSLKPLFITFAFPPEILSSGKCRKAKRIDPSLRPASIYPGKYEWAGQNGRVVQGGEAPSSLEDGDCSLRILNANLEYDDGVWQCQVTPSAFNTRDALISEGAELVVRGKSIYTLEQNIWTAKWLNLNALANYFSLL